jgi:hypothetical protein
MRSASGGPRQRARIRAVSSKLRRRFGQGEAWWALDDRAREARFEEVSKADHKEAEVSERPGRYRAAVVPHIYVNGASRAIEFYKQAFGAVELFRIAHPNGSVLHAELSICNMVFMIG